MSALLRHPAFILAALGSISGLLGTYFLGGSYGAAPEPGLYLVLTGLWFGFVIGFAVWRWGHASLAAMATVILTTWIAWEAAVNIAIQLDGHLLGSTVLFGARSYVAGFVAGVVGATITWAGAAVHVTPLRTTVAVLSIALAGAFLGLLLPATNYYDSGIVLLLPWQAAIAGLVGFHMKPVGGWSQHSEAALATES